MICPGRPSNAPYYKLCRWEGDGTCHPSSRIILDRTRIGVKFLRSETCIRAFARMKGYVIVEAILFDIAAKRNVSKEECILDLVGEFRKEREFGGKVDLNSSNK